MSTEGRYARINCRVWNDEKFRALSPEAKLIWLRFLAPVERGRIPGLFQAWPDGIRATVGLTVAVFDKGLLEIELRMPFKWDKEVGLIYLINALMHDPPRNPNQVKSWLTGLRELPECSLKDEATRGLKLFLESMGPQFAKPLAKLIPYTNPNPNPYHKENVFLEEPAKEDTKKDKDDALNGDALKVWEHYAKRYADTVNKRRRLGAAMKAKLKTRLETYKPDELIEAIDRLFTDEWSLGVGALELKRIVHSDEKVESWLCKPDAASVGKPAKRVVQIGGAKPGDAEAMRKQLGLNEGVRHEQSI
jgi:hypothetical protein